MKYLTKMKPLKSLSLVDKVEERLIEFFKENNLKIGDKIPKELDFAEALGVSRTVVREALLRLRTLGIIESKKHKGMVLTEPDIILNIERALDTKLFGEEMLKDIFELRLILEMGMADSLFGRKTAEDIEELDKIVLKEEKEHFDSTIFTLEYEIRFHGKLYEMSGNSTLQRFQKLLLPVFQYYHNQKNPMDERFEYTQKFVSHRDLLNELKAGNPESFRVAMRRHLEPHFDRILKWAKA